MKLYFCHSRDFDYLNELYQPIKNSSLSKQHEIAFPHEKANPTINTQNLIKNVDRVIAEVSFPSTGMGIELGWAHAFEVPIICIYQKGKVLSSSLRFVTDEFIEYTDSQDLINQLENSLLEFSKR